MASGTGGAVGNMLVVEPEVVASPLKQEILRLNEENYYLKLEVIKLVSTLKGTSGPPGTAGTAVPAVPVGPEGPEGPESTTGGTAGRAPSDTRKRKLPPMDSDDSDTLSVRDSPFIATPNELECFSLIDIPPDTPHIPSGDFAKVRETPLGAIKLDFGTPHDCNDFMFIDSADVENAFGAFVAS